MRAFSIQQPWAWCIVQGLKPIENRTWPTQVRGQVLIHAGKKFDKDGYDYIRNAFPNIPLPKPHEFELGGFVGVTTIIDCVTKSDSKWFFGTYGFVMKHSKRIPFIPYKGQLGFFKVPFYLAGEKLMPGDAVRVGTDERVYVAK